MSLGIKSDAESALQAELLAATLSTLTVLYAPRGTTTMLDLNVLVQQAILSHALRKQAALCSQLYLPLPCD